MEFRIDTLFYDDNEWRPLFLFFGGFFGDSMLFLGFSSLSWWLASSSPILNSLAYSSMFFCLSDSTSEDFDSNCCLSYDNLPYA